MSEDTVGFLKKECNRHANGICSTRSCLDRGGWKPGSPPDYSLATCEVYEAICQLERIPALESDLAESRQKLAEAQADCAAMREPLQQLVDFIDKEGPASIQWREITDCCEKAHAALASNAGDALVKELARLRAENAVIRREFLAQESDSAALRAQRDQAVLLARELGERLQEECNIDDRTGKPRWSNTREALAKLQFLNPPPSDDTLKV